MILDENDLRRGLEFIVGRWQPEFVVNAFSNDLAHIPAAEFKSEDGRDFTALTFEFFEDHTVKLSDGKSEKEETGAWEQTGWGEYHYTLGGFLDIPEGPMRDAAEKLTVQDGRLVFSIGFLAVALNKTAEGEVTKEPDIGEMEGDPSMTDIVGVYEVAKAMSFVGGEFELFTREEVAADLEKKLVDGEIEEDEVREGLRGFESVYEFTPDHRVICWMPLPEGVSDEEIRAAVEEGEILDVKDGMFSTAANEWKAVNGKYYYNSGEHRETFGEEQSPWDELETDGDGYITIGSGMIKLKKK